MHKYVNRLGGRSAGLCKEVLIIQLHVHGFKVPLSKTCEMILMMQKSIKYLLRGTLCTCICKLQSRSNIQTTIIFSEVSNDVFFSVTLLVYANNYFFFLFDTISLFALLLVVHQ